MTVFGIKVDSATDLAQVVAEGYRFVVATEDVDQRFCKASGLVVIGYVDRGQDVGNAPAMVDLTTDEAWARYRAGTNVVFTYLPQWRWQALGGPDLSNVPGLVSSSVVKAPGFSRAYPGDWSNRWFPYGGVTPTLLEYADGVFAFRGTGEEFLSLVTPKTKRTRSK